MKVMKIAKNYKKENMLEGPVVYFDERPREKEIKKTFEGEALGGSSNEVISICMNLDIGKISDEMFEGARMNLITEMLINPVTTNKNNQEMSKEYWDKNVANLNLLVEYAENGENIRIWYSNASYSMCGFYYINSILEEFDCKLYAIKLPEYQLKENKTIISYRSWGEIYPGKFYEFVKFEKEITRSEKVQFAKRWIELKKENSNLRTIINGKLISVNENFYDDFIRANIPDTEFRMGKLIGNVLGQYLLDVGDLWISQRIENMIDNGELTVIKDTEFKYEKILKK